MVKNKNNTNKKTKNSNTTTTSTTIDNTKTEENVNSLEINNNNINNNESSNIIKIKEQPTLPRLVILQILNQFPPLFNYHIQNNSLGLVRFLLKLILVCKEWKESIIPKLRFNQSKSSNSLYKVTFSQLQLVSFMCKYRMEVNFLGSFTATILKSKKSLKGITNDIRTRIKGLDISLASVGIADGLHAICDSDKVRTITTRCKTLNLIVLILFQKKAFNKLDELNIHVDTMDTDFNGIFEPLSKACPKLTKLKLVISRNNIDDDNFRGFKEISKYLTSLDKIDIQNPPILSESVYECFFKRIRDIKISYQNTVEDQSIEDVLLLLHGNTVVENFNLWTRNTIPLDSIIDLLNSNSKLLSLQLDAGTYIELTQNKSTPIINQTITELAILQSRNTGLQVSSQRPPSFLNLWKESSNITSLGQVSFHIMQSDFANILANIQNQLPKLKSLALSLPTAINDYQPLKNYLQLNSLGTTPLVSLSLFNVQHDIDLVDILSECTSLYELSINQALYSKPTCIIPFINSNHPSIKKLDYVWNNKQGMNHNDLIKPLSKNKTIVELSMDFHYCKTSPSNMLENITRVLNRNRSLQKLSLPRFSKTAVDKCNLDSTTLEQFKEAITKNTTIVHLDIFDRNLEIYNHLTKNFIFSTYIKPKPPRTRNQQYVYSTNVPTWFNTDISDDSDDEIRFWNYSDSDDDSDDEYFMHRPNACSLM